MKPVLAGLVAALGLCVVVVTGVHAGTLNVYVSDVFGVPMHPVAIEVRDSDSGVLHSALSDVTDAAGNHQFTLPDGRYDLTFTPLPGVRAFGAQRNTFRVLGATPLQVQLPAGRLLTGRLVLPGGAGAAHVGMVFTNAFGTAPVNTANAVTDEAGNVAVLVSPGAWTVAGEPRLDQRVAPRVLGLMPLTADHDFGTLVMLPGFVMSARVRAADLAPLADARLEVRVAGKRTALYTAFDRTDTTGAATFVLPPGIYDITATPPTGTPHASGTARGVVVSADRTLPEWVLPAGVGLSARCVTAAGAAVSGVECVADSLPALARLELPGSRSDADGAVHGALTMAHFRLAFVPPVVTRLVPRAFAMVNAHAPVALGDVVFAAGHWLDVHVREAGSGLPVPNVRFELVDAATGAALPTAVATVDSLGDARVTVGAGGYRLRVFAPAGGGGEWNDAHVAALQSVGDTSIVVLLTHPGLDAPSGPPLAAFALGQPWPNPVRDRVQWTAECATRTRLQLSVWDVCGRLVDRAAPVWVAGRATFEWDARDANGARVAPGSYWLRVGDGRSQAARRVLVIAK